MLTPLSSLATGTPTAISAMLITQLPNTALWLCLPSTAFVRDRWYQPMLRGATLSSDDPSLPFGRASSAPLTRALPAAQAPRQSVACREPPPSPRTSRVSCLQSMPQSQSLSRTSVSASREGRRDEWKKRWTRLCFASGLVPVEQHRRSAFDSTEPPLGSVGIK